MLLARAKLRFLREQPDDFFFCGEPCMNAHDHQRGWQEILYYHKGEMGKILEKYDHDVDWSLYPPSD